MISCTVTTPQRSDISVFDQVPVIDLSLRAMCRHLLQPQHAKTPRNYGCDEHLTTK